MRNKYFAKGLALTLASSMVLVGCGSTDSGSTDSGETANGKIEIDLWHGYATDKASELEALVDEYNEQSDTAIVVPKFVASSEEILPKVQTAIMNDSQPDLLWGAPTMTGVLHSTGKLVNVDPLVSDAWRSDIPEGLWNVGKFADGTYSVPVEAGTLVLIYNQDMFDAAGITEVPTTWDELYETAKKLTTDDQQGLAVSIEPTEKTTWFWLSFLEQNGGSLLNEDYTDIGFDRETLIETLTYYTNFIKEGISPITTGQDPFAEGKVAMTIGTQGAANAYITKNNMNAGVAMLPGKDELATGLGTNHYYVFNNGEKEIEESMKFLEWLTTGEKNAEWVIKAGYLPVSTTAKESEAFKSYVAEKTYFQTAADALAYGYARPALEEYPQMSNAISAAVEAIAYDKMTVEEGADKIISTVQSLLK